MKAERTPYIRMDGTRRPSIFATDKRFTARLATKRSEDAFAGVPLKLAGTPKLVPHKGAYSKARSA